MICKKGQRYFECLSLEIIRLFSNKNLAYVMQSKSSFFLPIRNALTPMINFPIFLPTRLQPLFIAAVFTFLFYLKGFANALCKQVFTSFLDHSNYDLGLMAVLSETLNNISNKNLAL